MTSRVATWTLVGCVLWATTGRAQPVPAEQHEHEPGASQYIDPVGGLTLDEAIARALEQEPGLRASRSDIDAARGARVQAGRQPNPQLTVSREIQHAGSDRQLNMTLAWPVEAYRRRGRVGVADQEIVAAEQSASDEARRLAADVRMKYGGLVAAVREVTVSDDLVDTLTRQLELVRARVDQGAAPPLERDVLQVELQRLQAERMLQTGHADHAMIELKRLLGLAPESPLAVRHTLEELVQRDGAPPGDASATAAERSDVREAAAHVRIAEARVDEARREGRWDLTLVGSFTRMDASFPQRGLNSLGAAVDIHGVFNFVGVGATVTMPLRNRHDGGIAEARAEQLGAAARLEAATLTAQAEIAAARARDEHSQRAVAVYSTGARALARRNLDTIGQTAALGRATTFDVLAEQRRFLDVERAYTNALSQAYETRVMLRLALGVVQ